MIAKRSDLLKTSLKMTQVTCLKKQRCSLCSSFKLLFLCESQWPCDPVQ